MFKDSSVRIPASRFRVGIAFGLVIIFYESELRLQDSFSPSFPSSSLRSSVRVMRGSWGWWLPS